MKEIVAAAKKQGIEVPHDDMALAILPGTSPKARQYITTARKIMYSNDPQMTKGYHQAIAGGDSLSKSAAPFIVMMVTNIQQKMGPLDDQDLLMLVQHLAASIIADAMDAGDPDTQNPKQAQSELVAAVMQILEGQPPASQQAAPPMAQLQPPPDAPPQNAPAPPGPPLGQLQ